MAPPCCQSLRTPMMFPQSMSREICFFTFHFLQYYVETSPTPTSYFCTIAKHHLRFCRFRSAALSVAVSLFVLCVFDRVRRFVSLRRPFRRRPPTAFIPFVVIPLYARSSTSSSRRHCYVTINCRSLVNQ
jgi:hypothetical protein